MTQDCNMWDKFDLVCMATYTGYRDRYFRAKGELKRVGLLAKTEFFWDFDSPFKDILMDVMSKAHKNTLTTKGAFGCAMNHYRMWKTTLELGYRRPLFMEDDILFHKDIDLIRGVVSGIPDSDIALFDWFRSRKMTDREFSELSGRPRVGGHWTDCHGVALVSCGAYTLSEKGLRYMIGKFESCLSGPGKLKAADMFFRPTSLKDDVSAVCAFPHVAIQGDVSISSCGTSKWYEGVGVDKKNYGP